MGLYYECVRTVAGSVVKKHVFIILFFILIKKKLKLDKKKN